MNQKNIPKALINTPPNTAPKPLPKPKCKPCRTPWAVVLKSSGTD